MSEYTTIRVRKSTRKFVKDVSRVTGETMDVLLNRVMQSELAEAHKTISKKIKEAQDRYDVNREERKNQNGAQ